MIIRIKDFIKKELSGWNKTEIIGMVLILLIISFNAVVLKDSIIAIISAICGLMYTIIAGKGKMSCYIFGLTGSGFYAYLAFKNGLYGNFGLYLLYYIPMQILGFLNWSKHLKKTTNEIYKTRVNNRRFLTFCCVLLCSLTIIILWKLNDINPVIDGITTALSIAGMYLTVKRCIEQWVIWGIVNILTASMWITLIISGQKVFSTVIMWIVYFILSVYFYIQWKKEINN